MQRAASTLHFTGRLTCATVRVSRHQGGSRLETPRHFRPFSIRFPLNESRARATNGNWPSVLDRHPIGAPQTLFALGPTEPIEGGIN